MVYVPLTPVLLTFGLLPLFCAHPKVFRVITLVLPSLLQKRKSHFQRFIDNNSLSEAQWYSQKREVEMMESERWSGSGTGWSKVALKHDEKPWSSTYLDDQNQRDDNK